MGRKNLIPECLDCKCFLDDKNWPKSAKKDGWRVCIDCLRERVNKHAKKYNKKKRIEDKDFDRKRHLKYDYSLTLEDYNKMFEQQGGVCAICGKKETAKNQHGIKRLAIDHNHSTGKVRGLLCSKCNRMLGMVEDDENTLLNALVYLKKEDKNDI